MSCKQTEEYNEYMQEGVKDDALDNINLHLSYYDKMKECTKAEDIQYWAKHVKRSATWLLSFMQKENTKKYLPEYLEIQIKELLNRDYVPLENYPLARLLTLTFPNKSLSQTQPF